VARAVKRFFGEAVFGLAARARLSERPFDPLVIAVHAQVGPRLTDSAWGSRSESTYGVFQETFERIRADCPRQ
jgi:hypothetical protein